eukprot:3942008-Rhodomonas_salina.6
MWVANLLACRADRACRHAFPAASLPASHSCAALNKLVALTTLSITTFFLSITCLEGVHGGRSEAVGGELSTSLCGHDGSTVQMFVQRV